MIEGSMVSADSTAVSKTASPGSNPGRPVLLDAMVAEHVMGWKLIDRKAMGWGDGPVVYGTDSYANPTRQDWRPSENMADAWMLVQKLSPARWLGLSEYRDGWRAIFSSTQNRAPLHVKAEAATAPEAICKAALLAVGVPLPHEQQAVSEPEVNNTRDAESPSRESEMTQSSSEGAPSSPLDRALRELDGEIADCEGLTSVGVLLHPESAKAIRAEVERLNAENAALREQGWRPIGALDHQMRRVLVGNEYGGADVEWSDNVPSHWTHFRELPAPPESDPESAPMSQEVENG